MAMLIVLVQLMNQYYVERTYNQSIDQLLRIFIVSIKALHPVSPTYDLCDGHEHCQHGDDEQFCNTNRSSLTSGPPGGEIRFISPDIKRFLVDSRVNGRSWEIIYFTLDKMTQSAGESAKKKENTAIASPLADRTFDQRRPRCHRGLDLRVWSNNRNRSTTSTCLCPPSYYGDTCQYQNQRISLGIQFRALSDSWQTLFTIVIS